MFPFRESPAPHCTHTPPPSTVPPDRAIAPPPPQPPGGTVTKCRYTRTEIRPFHCNSIGTRRHNFVRRRGLLGQLTPSPSGGVCPGEGGRSRGVGVGRTQVNGRSTYARPGMPLQQRSAVLNDICGLHRLTACALGRALMCCFVDPPTTRGSPFGGNGGGGGRG